MPKAPIVLADTNVLVPALLRNLLIELALTDVIGLYWSDQIFVELRRTLLKLDPSKSPPRVDSLLRAMDRALPDARVQPPRQPSHSVLLPHANDQHVLVAAMSVPCTHIVTANLRHFPNTLISMNVPPLQAVHPDKLVFELLTTNPTATLLALEIARQAFKAPQLSQSAFANALAQINLKQTAELLRHLRHE